MIVVVVNVLEENDVYQSVLVYIKFQFTETDQTKCGKNKIGQYYANS